MNDGTITTMPPRAPRRRARRWMARLGLVAVVVPASLWGWGRYEQHGLDRRIAALRQAGEPVTPADLASAPVPDGDNAAAHFRAAAGMIDTKSAAWDTYSKEVGEPRLPLGPKERSAIRAVADANQGALQRATRAARMGRADWALLFATPMIETLMPDFGDQRLLARLLLADGLIALEADEPIRTLARVDELVAQSRAMDCHPSLLGHLLAGSMCVTAAELAGEVVRDSAASGDQPTLDMRRRMSSLISLLLEERELSEGLMRGHQAERVQQLDALTAVADGRMSLNAFAELVGARGDGRLPGLEWALRGWFIRNASAAVDFMNGVIDDARACDTEAEFSTRRAGRRDSIHESRVYLLASLTLPDAERATRKHYRVLAARRMAATALAIALYRADHDDQLPTTLADLVPAYLPEVPTDPVAGGDKPLGYVTDPARPRLYTVGDNGVDDGGRPADPLASRDENLRVSDDVVDLTRQPRAATGGAGPTRTSDDAPASPVTPPVRSARPPAE